MCIHQSSRVNASLQHHTTRTSKELEVINTNKSPNKHLSKKYKCKHAKSRWVFLATKFFGITKKLYHFALQAFTLLFSFKCFQHSSLSKSPKWPDASIGYPRKILTRTYCCGTKTNFMVSGQHCFYVIMNLSEI